MKNTLIILIFLITGQVALAQKYFGLNFESEYYLQNSYYNESNSSSLPVISKMIPTWGYGLSGIYQKNIKRNWSYAIKGSFIWGSYKIGVNYPLYRFSPDYEPGEFFNLIYKTPRFSRFELQFRIAKCLTPSRRLRVSPYLSLIPSWFLTRVEDFDQDYRYQTDFSRYKILVIDGQVGGGFKGSSIVDQFTDWIIPGYSIGLNFDYPLGKKYSILRQRPTSIKFDISYMSTIPVTDGGVNAISVYAYRDDLGIEERMYNSDRLHRININVGILIPIKKQSDK